MEGGEKEEDDNRREAAIASSPSLRPNIKPKPGLFQAQLSKFQELHKRRLQIKAKSKVDKKTKGLADGKSKSHRKTIEANERNDGEPSRPVGDSFTDPSTLNGVATITDRTEQSVEGNLAIKQRKKLHWGLDTRTVGAEVQYVKVANFEPRLRNYCELDWVLRGHMIIGSQVLKITTCLLSKISSCKS